MGICGMLPDLLGFVCATDTITFLSRVKNSSIYIPYLIVLVTSDQPIMFQINYLCAS